MVRKQTLDKQYLVKKRECQMPTRLLLFVLGLTFSFWASATTGFVDPLVTAAPSVSRPSRSPLTAITTAGDRLVAAGWRGLIMYSDDGGKSWRQSSVPVSVDLTAVAFPTPTDGWVVGHDGLILHSDDAGKTWHKQMDGVEASKLTIAYYEKKAEEGDQRARSLLEDARAHEKDNASIPFLSVLFLDAREGFAVGSFGLSMHTSDGGRHWLPWSDHVDNPEGLHLFGLCELNGSLYIASEKGTVFVRRPGEQQFVRELTGYRGSLFGLVGVRDTVVAYGLRGTAFRSIDGGRTWSAVETGTGATITAGTALPNGRLALVDVAGSVTQSDIGMTRFSLMSRVRMPMLTGIASPKRQGWVVITGVAGNQVVDAYVAP